jgi:hypothetical protein
VASLEEYLRKKGRRKVLVRMHHELPEGVVHGAHERTALFLEQGSHGDDAGARRDPIDNGSRRDAHGRARRKTDQGIVAKASERLISDVLTAMSLERRSPVKARGLKSWNVEEDVESELAPEERKLRRHTAGKLQHIGEDRPDLKFAAKDSSRHLRKPTRLDTRKVRRIGRHLAGTRDMESVMVSDGADWSEVAAHADWN